MDDVTRLALAAGRGDDRALAAFVHATQAEVWRLCAHLGDRAQADDLTQETYLRAIPALARFEGRSSARTWLLSIARRVCADAVRRQVRRRRLARRIDPSDELVGSGSTLELDELLSRLDPDRRAAFVMTQVLGLSYAEAAEASGCPIGTIRSRVARAREQLLAVIDEAQSG